MMIFQALYEETEIIKRVFPYGYTTHGFEKALKSFKSEYSTDQDLNAVKEAMNTFLDHFNVHYLYMYDSEMEGILLSCDVKEESPIHYVASDGSMCRCESLFNLPKEQMKAYCTQIYYDHIFNQQPMFLPTHYPYLVKQSYLLIVELFKSYLGLESMASLTEERVEQVETLTDLLRFCIEPVFEEFLFHQETLDEIPQQCGDEIDGLKSLFYQFALNNHWIFDQEGNLLMLGQK